MRGIDTLTKLFDLQRVYDDLVIEAGITYSETLEGLNDIERRECWIYVRSQLKKELAEGHEYNIKTVDKEGAACVLDCKCVIIGNTLEDAIDQMYDYQFERIREEEREAMQVQMFGKKL